jgi:prolipoprotein diacylglyceryltransferase
VVSRTERSSVIVAAVLGAAIGSKVLAWFEDPSLWHTAASLWPGGKTIVGGLLGGTLAVEMEKRRLGIRTRTGDLFAIPITIGIAIGRIGCFLGGIDDHTAGTPSSLPWAVDFGDGIPRHPTQLYEIVFLMILSAVLRHFRSLRTANGDLYRIFLFAYLVWRFAIDFLKPEPAFAGLSSIQWVCLLGAIWYSRDMIRIFGAGRTRDFSRVSADGDNSHG